MRKYHIYKLGTPPKWWWWVMGLLAILFLTSCRPTTQVVTEYQDRVEYRDRLVYDRDTTYIKDSVFIKQSADTVWLTRWRVEYREKIKIDSLVHIVTDSVYLERPVYIEHEQSKWSATKEAIGGITLWLIALLLLGLGVSYWWHSLH